MDVNAFVTTRAATTPQTGAQSGVTTQGQALTGGNGVFSGIGGMNFIDLIFARISEGQDLKNDTAGAALITTPVVTPIATKPEELTTDILGQLIDIDTENSDVLALDLAGLNIEGDLTADTNTEGDSLKQLRSYLDTLLNGLPAEQRPQIVQVTPAEFKQTLTDLKANLNAGDPSLIATGLTPEDLTALIAQMEAAQKTGTLDMTAMVKIVPPPVATTDKPTLFLPRALVAIQEQAQTGDNTVMTDSEADAIATALNKLVVGGTAPDAPVKKAAIDTLSIIPGGVSTLDSPEHMSLREFELAGKIDVKTAETDGKNIPSTLEKAAEKIKNLIGAGLSTILGNAPGSVESASNWQDVFPEGMDSLSAALNGKPLAIGTTATMTSLVTSAPQATYPHPATQAVAATITKAANAGEDKAFTIKLDPPELGRVEVKMMIDKHNAVKAHLVIEKPETFLMLQRDAHILERSLQGIGLDTSGSGLSFELAQDNMFQNEGERGGERYQSGSKSADGIEGETVIDSTMTWSVDPETGMQRYNILV